MEGEPAPPRSLRPEISPDLDSAVQRLLRLDPTDRFQDATELRAALLALNSSKNGQAVLKRMGLTGFKETSPQEFLDFLKWLGDLEVKR